MAVHWHAFTYNGAFPPDKDAKNPSLAVPPVSLRDWFRKPASMRRGVYVDAESGHKWLDVELREVFAHPERLDDALAYYRMHLDLGQDAYVSHYSVGGSSIWVRALLTCPRTGADPRPITCPEPPKK